MRVSGRFRLKQIAVVDMRRVLRGLPISPQRNCKSVHGGEPCSSVPTFPLAFWPEPATTSSDAPRAPRRFSAMALPMKTTMKKAAAGVVSVQECLLAGNLQHSQEIHNNSEAFPQLLEGNEGQRYEGQAHEGQGNEGRVGTL